MARPKLFVCTESDCRKALDKSPGLEALARALRVELVCVGCQKVCEGPVVGVKVDGRFEWFERIKGNKTLESLESLVDKGQIDARLEKRRAKKRSGKLRT